MDKIDHKSKDILGGNVEKIAELFPGVVTEAKDEATGELKKVVDFDLLRQHLSDELVEGDRERFRLDWPGKKASILKANTPITKTLRPVREDSEDFDTTQNVFIEGDNFEVLKVLQESYLGKIKMIYIDPPYNTGKDFIYKDNFAADKGEYEEEIGVRDDENGGKLVKNTETNGRYHSDWLSMMQERLIVARDLLTDDGVIFISIDDNESGNLRELLDDVMDENNMLAENVVIVNPGGRKYGSFSKSLDRLFVYAKNIDMVKTNEVADEAAKFEYKDSVGGFNYHELLNRNIRVFNSTNRPNLRYPFYVDLNSPDINGFYPVYLENKEGLTEVWGREREGLEAVWTWGRDTARANISELFATKNSKDGSIQIQRKLRKLTGLPNTLWPSAPEIAKEKKAAKYTSFSASQEVQKLFDGNMYFDFPKPVALVKRILEVGSDKDSIVIDFFSGSGTTAHAVMQLNAEDGGNRKHIQVQLAEPTDENSEAYKAGYKTIPEISRERIRRAAKKIREDYAEQIAKREIPLDTGFRAYKLSSSNFVDTAQHPAQTTQASLLDTTDNIKDDRTPEDLLTEVILDLGLTLDLPIEHRDIAGHSVFFVGGNSLVACFDDKVSLDIVDGIAAENPLRIVFKDSSFANDETRINIDIRLKQLSPDTTVQVV